MGFSNWKNAVTGKTQKGHRSSINLKGFAKHANNHTHKEAMTIWEKHKIRSSGSSLSVNRMVVLQRIPEHRRWVKRVFTVMEYLARNGIPFRSDVQNTNFLSENPSDGVYLTTFSDLLYKLDES